MPTAVPAGPFRDELAFVEKEEDECVVTVDESDGDGDGVLSRRGDTVRAFDASCFVMTIVAVCERYRQ